MTSVVSTTRSYVACALNSRSEDGISFPSANSDNIEALIQDYFNESTSKESGSDDDEECTEEFSQIFSHFMCNK